MSDPPAGRFLRLAGRAVLADGSSLLWSVAEGRRGRRWRAASRQGGSLTHVLLLEVGTDGRLGRLELTTPAGLLTLHPEPDEASIQGNVVAADGVRPLAFAWSTEHAIDVVGRPIAAAAMLHRLARSLAVGSARDVPILSIESDLSVHSGQRRVAREAEGVWRISGDRGELTLRLAPEGVPEFEGDSEVWPLED